MSRPAAAAPARTAPSGGKVLPHNIVTELETSFLDYSMSVIVSRALPDARDGLKPVQRRILMTLQDEGLSPTRPYKKAAAVVGSALARYHPHGDTSVYDAMVRLAQDFVMNVPFVDGQGNWGSPEDSAAAYRYTEARMTTAAAAMLRDLDRRTVDFRPNFDNSRTEPVVLPAALPNLLLNGAEGIAVGMATKIPPHNLRELGAALDLLCEDPAVSDAALLAKVRGPDFPTGGLLLKGPEIRELYTTGRARLTLRARAHVEKAESGRAAIVLTEMPYGVVKSTVIERLAAMVREGGEAPGTGARWNDLVATLRDESDRDGMRMVVELKRDADPRRVLSALYRKTDLQITYGAQMIALVDGAPVQLSLRQALEVYVAHRLVVVRRRAEHELERVSARAHIVDGLLVAVDAIDAVVALVRRAKGRDEAREGLVKKFRLSVEQANAILDLRIAALTALDVGALRTERTELSQRGAELKRLLASERERRDLVRSELREAVSTFAVPRRTEVVAEAAALDDEEEAGGGRAGAVKGGARNGGVHLQEASGTVVLTPEGTIRVVAADSRWKGAARDWMTIRGTEHGVVLTSAGRAVPLTTARLAPTAGTRGVALGTLVSGLGADERPLVFLDPERQAAEGVSLVFVLANGLIKRLAALDVANPRAPGVAATKLADEDVLVEALVARDTDSLLVFTREGKALRTLVSDIPVQGVAARGVAGIRLGNTDRVVSACVAEGPVIMLTGAGVGRRTALDDFPVQGRGGQGVWLYRPTPKTGDLVWAGCLTNEQQVLVETAEGRVALDAKGLSAGDRATSPKPVKDLPGPVTGASQVYDS